MRVQALLKSFVAGCAMSVREQVQGQLLSALLATYDEYSPPKREVAEVKSKGKAPRFASAAAEEVSLAVTAA
jgi:hypothetical protein